MRNLFYYLKKFGNLSFEQRSFGEVDSLILSQLAYLQLENFVPHLGQYKKSVELLSADFAAMCSDTLDQKRNLKLLKALTKTSRYESLKVNNYARYFSSSKVEQFCAVMFEFENFVYVAYQGTDLSFVGWQEDFNMILYDVIPSQEDAKKYLNEVAVTFKKPFYVGGHSKGGNLAVYAAYASEDDLKERIIKVYDHDGPGFSKNIFEDERFKLIESKIDKTTCEESMIGILLNHSSKMRFVKSWSVGIFQHDLYNWQITKDGYFKMVKDSNFFSKVFESSIKDFIEELLHDERQELIRILFFLAMEKPKSTIFDFKRQPLRYSKGIKSRYHTLKSTEKKFLKAMSKRYGRIWWHNFKLKLTKKTV